MLLIKVDDMEQILGKLNKSLGDWLNGTTTSMESIYYCQPKYDQYNDCREYLGQQRGRYKPRDKDPYEQHDDTRKIKSNAPNFDGSFDPRHIPRLDL